jgi:mannose-6-phosphate isomerase-like protein (cupin superfamily)
VPFVNPRSLEAHEPRPGWRGRFFHSEHMTFACYDIAPGADVHAHEHPNEEVWHVVEGAIEPTRAIVVDYPLRESVAGIPLR